MTTPTFVTPQARQARQAQARPRGGAPTRVTYQPDFMAVGVRPAPRPDLAYMDFANQVLGGGVLGRGWVQEEQMLFCTDVMPGVEEYRRRYNQLHVTPLLIRAHVYLEITNPGVQDYSLKTVAPVLTVPAANILAAAAPDNRANPRNPQGLTDWFNVARDAFALAVDNNITTVVSGPWGAGVFKNTFENSAQLQVDAANAAGLPELVLYGFPTDFAQVTAASGTVW